MKVDNVLDAVPYDEKQFKELHQDDDYSIKILSVEKGVEVPPHTSPKNATIMIAEGKVSFSIKGEVCTLKQFAMFSFKKDELHSLKALENSKIIIFCGK